MSRIPETFARCAEAGRTALIPFITAGDPGPDLTVPLMHRMVAAGADLIELGVPFSDPIADGPVIQRATERALAQGVSLRDVLSLVSAFREENATTPVVLMGYLNPIERMGYAAFASAAQAAGVDGALVVDVPPEEGHELVSALRAAGLDLVYLLAPTSDAKRIASIGAVASGFVYYVSLKGVTGSADIDVAAVAGMLQEIRKQITLPVGVGFGIKDGATAARLAPIADAVIVGSAIVSRIEDLAASGQTGQIPAVIGAFIEELRRAIDGADQVTRTGARA